MAKAKETVTLKPNYLCWGETITLWGVIFTAGKPNEDGEAEYTAEVDAETAKSLIDANRAVEVK